MQILRIEPTEWTHLKGDPSMFTEREYPFWDKFIEANRDGIGLLQKADLELKDMIARALDHAKAIGCAIDEIVVATSMLMDPSTFYDWMCRGYANRLATTVHDQFDPALRFQVGNYMNGVVIRFNAALLPDKGTGCAFLDSDDSEFLPRLSAR